MCATRVQVTVVAIIVALTSFAEADPATPRDEGTATLLSVAGTAGPILMVGATIRLAADSEGFNPRLTTLGIASIAGIYALPSAGHWYSGKGFTRGFAIRTGGLFLGGLGLVKLIKGTGCHCFCDDSNSEFWLLGIGGVLILGGAAHDIATAASRARAVNASMQPTITPVPMPGGGGVSVSLRF